MASNYAGRVVTRARYNATVKKYGQARADAGIKKYGLKLAPAVATYTPKPTTTNKPPVNNTPSTNTKQIKPQLSYVARRDGNYTSSQTARNNAAAQRDAYNARIRNQNRVRQQQARLAAYRKRIELARKNKYQAYEKKAGGSANILKLAADKYGVNDLRYKKIKSEVNRYAKAPTSVREVKTTIPVKTTSSKLNKTQYNALINKYGDVNGVINAVKLKGGTKTQINKMKTLLNSYTGIAQPKASKVIENKTTVTDVNKRDTTLIGDNTKKKVIVPIANTIPKPITNTITKPTITNTTPKPTITNTTSKVPGKNKDFTPVKFNETKTLSTLKKMRLSGLTDKAILQKVVDKGVDINSDKFKTLKDFITKNPQKDGTEKVTSNNLIDKTPKVVAKTKIDALANVRDNKISKTAENFIKSSELIAGNNTKLQEFYTKMATELKTFIKDNKVREEKALERTKNTELNKVVGQIRATLARRGINIANIPAEQLIAMSGELGANAMRRIDKATTNMERAVSDLTQRKTGEINKYLEQGLIKQNEADKSIEQLRQLKEKMISNIKDNYINNTFKIAETYNANTKTKKAQATNTISTFINQLGITGPALKVMNNYLTNGTSEQALQSMITDLNNPASELYRAAQTAKERQILATKFQGQIDLMKASRRFGRTGVNKIKLTDKQSNLMGILNLSGKITEKFFKDNYTDIIGKIRNRTNGADITLSNGVVIPGVKVDAGSQLLDKTFTGLVGN